MGFRFITLSLIGLISGLPLLSGTVVAQNLPELEQEQLVWIADQIFANECNRQVDCLTSWNAGEDFPSLGLGHFIWYQQGQQEIFAETFPALLAFMKAAGTRLPDWLNTEAPDSPWHTREEFLAQQDSPQTVALREFLLGTLDLQSQFIITRFEGALANILNSLSDPEQQTAYDRVKQNFYAVAGSSAPYGMYALIDYVNFKGEGLAEAERYQGQGWGLKQVLLGMPPSEDALDAFVLSATMALAQRVKNAPADRNEQRWLPGWNNRLQTYLPDQ